MLLFAALVLAAVASAEIAPELMQLQIATVKAIKVRRPACAGEARRLGHSLTFRGRAATAALSCATSASRMPSN